MTQTKTICFANQKGGVGKSTSCISTARCLAEKGKKVLVVDADYQMNATYGLGVMPLEDQQNLYTLFETLHIKGKVPNVEEAICHANGVDVIPASWDLSHADFSFATLGKEVMLKEILSSIDGTYDYVLIDTPPNLGICVINALSASDYLVIPCTPTYWANGAVATLMDTVQMVRRITNSELKIAGVLITDAELRTNSAKANLTIANMISEEMEIPMFESWIPHSVKVRESADSCSDIITEAPNSKPAIAYRETTNELLRRMA